jgi:phage/plasmid-like protein (TIGR03299 family)
LRLNRKSKFSEIFSIKGLSFLIRAVHIGFRTGENQMTDHVETMAYDVTVPWHGLGVRVDKNISPDEMLKAAKLDWKISAEPIYTKTEAGEIRIPGKRAMIRSSDRRIMGIASKNWHPFQNENLLKFFTDYCSAGGASLETAGSLRNGQIVWALANLHDGFKVGGNDQVDGYLLFTSPHKIGEAIRVRTTTVRVVCANTLAMAERGGNIHYRQTHTSEFNIDAAKASVELAHETLARAAKRAQTIHNLKISIDDKINLIDKFFGNSETVLDFSENKRAQNVLESIEKAPGAEPETGWGFLNGVTHWADHVNGRNAATRMFKSWVGDTAKLKLEVEEHLFEMAS